MKIFAFSLTLILAMVFSGAEAQSSPPPLAMPNASDKKLVDSIIRITHHEKYFLDYCTKKVRTYAVTNSWPASKLNSVLKSIKFENYSSTIYNSYANYSSNELEELLQVLIRMNKKSKEWSRMILTNYMMQNNLDLFVESVIEEKYVH